MNSSLPAPGHSVWFVIARGRWPNYRTFFMLVDDG